MDAGDLSEIRKFVERILADRDDHAPLDDEGSLVKSGRLDSLSVVKLVTFLESRFAVDFAKIEFDLERFDSIVEIAAMVEESRRLA